MSKISMLFSLLFLWANSLSAGTADQFFQSGNADFQKGDFASAIKNYESALAEGLVSPEVFVNLGHCFFQEKNFARAILSYERARLLEPGDVVLNADLEIARRRAGVENQSQNGVFSFFENVLDGLSPNIWAGLTLVFGWLAATGIFFFWKNQDKKKRKSGIRLAVAVSAIFLLTLVFSWKSADHRKNPMAGIVLTEISAHPAADATTEVLENLKPGEKVDLLELLSGWWKIRLPGGGMAWVAGDAVEKI